MGVRRCGGERATVNAELAPRANCLEEGSGARLPCDQRETGSGVVPCCEFSVNIGSYQLTFVLLHGTTDMYNSTLSAKPVVKQIKVCVLCSSKLSRAVAHRSIK